MSIGLFILIMLSVIAIGTWAWICFGPKGGFDKNDPIFDD